MDNNIGIAVGENGTIIRSSNGGSSWSTVNLGLNSNLHKVYILNSNVGYIVGDASILIKTTNKGFTWTYINPPEISNIYSIYFLNEEVGYIGLNDYATIDTAKLYRTSNRGIGWEEVVSISAIKDDGNINIVDIQFINNQIGYIGIIDNSTGWGPGTILKSINGGDSWAFFESLWLHDLHFKEVDYGIIVGGHETWHAFLRVVDNGIVNPIFDRSEGPDFYSCFITPNNSAWAVGGWGTIYHSYNYLEGWGQVNSGFESQIKSICSSNENKFFLTGELNSYFDYYTFFKDNNDFLFKSLYYDESDNPKFIFMIDSIYGYQIRSGLLKTTNGGITWIENILAPSDFDLQGIHFLNRDIGWAYGNQINKTNDGAASWATQFELTGGFVFTDLMFVDSQIGFAVATDGTNSRAYKTINGGDDWLQLTLPPVGKLTSIYFKEPNVGVITGSSNTLLKSIDGGITWTPIIIENSTSDTYTDVEYYKNLILVSC